MQDCMHKQSSLCIQAAYSLKHLYRLCHQHGRIFNTVRFTRFTGVLRWTEPLATVVAQAEMHSISHETMKQLCEVKSRWYDNVRIKIIPSTLPPSNISPQIPVITYAHTYSQNKKKDAQHICVTLSTKKPVLRWDIQLLPVKWRTCGIDWLSEFQCNISQDSLPYQT